MSINRKAAAIPRHRLPNNLSSQPFLDITINEMADGTAPTSAYDSFGDFHDLASQQKDWQQPFDMDMTLRADGLYIPPDRSFADNHSSWTEHPEAVDDDEDEDDDMFDFDFPVGSAAGSYSSGSVPPQFSYPTANTQYPADDSRLGDGYDIYRASNSMTIHDTFYSAPYKAPVDSIAPHDLQLSHDPLPVSLEDVPRFEPASPIDYDTMDATPDLIHDDASSETLDNFDVDMDAEMSDSQVSSVEESHIAHGLESTLHPLSQEPTVIVIPEVAQPEPASAPVRPSTSTNAKRKKVAHGPHRCDMALPGGDACNKAFTRPYDLARHQETIHAQVRKMFTCPECGDKSKTFSRMDALSRHIRIKHSRKD